MTSKDFKALVLVVLLVGLASGLALATRELGRFSPVPNGLLVGVIVLAGLALGGLVGGFARLLGALLAVALWEIFVITGALTLPEIGDSGLGLEVALPLALGKAVLNCFFFLPLMLISAMIGRLLHRE